MKKVKKKQKKKNTTNMAANSNLGREECGMKIIIADNMSQA